MHKNRLCLGRSAVWGEAEKIDRPKGWKPALKRPHSWRANHTYHNKHARKGLTLGSM